VPDPCVSAVTDLDLVSFLRAIPDPRMRRGVRIPSCYLLLIEVGAFYWTVLALTSLTPGGSNSVDLMGLADGHKSEKRCDRTSLRPLGGQGAMRRWGYQTKPSPSGSPDPTPC